MLLEVALSVLVLYGNHKFTHRQDYRVAKVPLEFLRQGKSRVNASFPTAVRQAPLIAFLSLVPLVSIKKLKRLMCSVISVAEPLMSRFSAPL